MGIFEQLLEANKLMQDQMADLQNKLLSMQETINSCKQKTPGQDDFLFLKFKGKDKLNASMAAKIIGITQTELFNIVNSGLLSSIGEKKRIFLADEVMRYMKGDRNIQNPKSPAKHITKKNKKTVNDVISNSDLKELLVKQAS